MSAARPASTARAIYHREGVGHDWIVDPERKNLTVLRRTDEGYLYARSASRNHLVRAEPFGEVELRMRDIFPDE